MSSSVRPSSEMMMIFFDFSGDCEKVFETYMEYADLSLINLNTPQAIRLLAEVEEFVLVRYGIIFLFLSGKRQKLTRSLNYDYSKGQFTPRWPAVLAV